MSDDEFNRLLDEFPKRLELHLTWAKYFQKLVNAGRKTGLTDIQIGDIIRQKYEGQIPEITIRKALPPPFKHQEKTNKRYAIKVSHNEQTDNNNKEIDIPAPKYETKEVEPEPITKDGVTYGLKEWPELKKGVTKEQIEGLIITATLDVIKFENELKIGKMNKDKKLKLHIKDGEVVKIG